MTTSLPLAQHARREQERRDRARKALTPKVHDHFTLTWPQFSFARSRFRFPAFVGGFGSGKTFAGVIRAVSLKTQCVGQDVCYYLPTYPLIRDIAFPRFTEVLDALKIRHKLNKTGPFIDLPDYYGQIKFRTMDQPERIVGYEVAHSILDELDTLPTAKAQDVWIKVLARNRQKCAIGNTIAVATTPEGFRFVWQRWVRDANPDYRIYKARTIDNAMNLPDGYIESLMNSYPSNLLQAYLDGEFVNLTSGTVYHAYDRVKHQTPIGTKIERGEALHVGMDFIVGRMAAIVHVLRPVERVNSDGLRVQVPVAMALAEKVNVFDTPAMIALLKRDYPEHPIHVYPDASGGGRRTVEASQSDLSLLRQAGFRVLANPVNPMVRDRVLSMNKLFEDMQYLVDPLACPTYAECLEKQAYDKNGEPDKTGDLDHAPDAGGYFINYKFPVVRRTASINPLRM